MDSVKLLGVTISSSLSWNLHIDEVIKKASKRLYFLVQLKRARVPPNDLVLFCTACIRSMIYYAIPAFYHALPQYLKNELVRLQKRAISIIVPGANYNTGMEVLGILPLGDHLISFIAPFLTASFRTQIIRLETCCLQLAAATVTT